MFDAQCGERLREEREGLRLSQQALADLAGVQRAMLSRYERGIAEPGASVLMKLAQVGIDVDYVLFGALAPRDTRPGFAAPGWGRRLKEERERLGFAVDRTASIAGIVRVAQLGLERERGTLTDEYLESLAPEGFDAPYIVKGERTPMPNAFVLPAQSDGAKPPVAAETGASYVLRREAVTRQLTPEEAALLDNYNAADEKGRAAARSVLDALAEPKKRANG